MTDAKPGGEISTRDAASLAWLLAAPPELVQLLGEATAATVDDKTPPVQLQALYRALGWRLVSWQMTQVLGTPDVRDVTLLPRGMLQEGDAAARERYERSRIVVRRTDAHVVVEAGCWGRWFDDWKQAAGWIGGVLQLARLGKGLGPPVGDTEPTYQLGDD